MVLLHCTKKTSDGWPYLLSHLDKPEIHNEHLLSKVSITRCGLMEDSLTIPLGSKINICQQPSPPALQIRSEPFAPFFLCSLLICPEKVEARVALRFALDIMPGTDCYGLNIYWIYHADFGLCSPTNLFGLKIHLGPILETEYTYRQIFLYSSFLCSSHVLRPIPIFTGHVTHLICIPLVLTC